MLPPRIQTWSRAVGGRGNANAPNGSTIEAGDLDRRGVLSQLRIITEQYTPEGEQSRSRIWRKRFEQLSNSSLRRRQMHNATMTVTGRLRSSRMPKKRSTTAGSSG